MLRKIHKILNEKINIKISKPVKLLLLNSKQGKFLGLKTIK